MNKKFLMAWIVVFVAWMAGSFIVHGTLLHQDYTKLAHLYRSETEARQYFPWMILAHVIMAGAFVWIYSRGVEAKPWPIQGIRFGVAVALLSVVPMYMIYYVVQPLPGPMVAKQIVLDAILVIILGIIAAFLYRIPSRL